MTPWLALLVAFAPAGFTATDNQWTPTSLTATAGASLTFAYPDGTEEHNARFTKAGVSCTTDNVGATGRSVPESSEAKGWSGQCTFAQDGVYDFVCDLHPEMTGTVTVGTPPAQQTPTPTPTPDAGATPAPNQGTPTVTPTPAARKLTVAATQKGSAIKGTIAGVTGKVTIDAYLGSKRVGKATRTGAGSFTVKVSKRGKLTLKVTAGGKTDIKKVTLKR